MNHPPQILDRCAKNSKVTQGTSQKVAKKHRTAMCYIYRFCSDSSVSSWTILPKTCHYLEHKIWQSWRLDPKRCTLQCEVVVYFLDVHIAIRCIHTPIRLQYGPEVFRTFLLRGFLSWPRRLKSGIQNGEKSCKNDEKHAENHRKPVRAPQKVMK